jgi:hypothetical protein
MTYNQLRILKALEVAAAALMQVAEYGGTAVATPTTAVAAREQKRLLKRMALLQAEFAAREQG